jgi:hypothetical protein
MEKLYLAKRKSIPVETVFVSDQNGWDKDYQIQREAEEYLNEEESNNLNTIAITEITSTKQLPKSWRKGGVYIWGSDQQETPEEWLTRQTQEKDPEYDSYLRLKKKFERQ